MVHPSRNIVSILSRVSYTRACHRSTKGSRQSHTQSYKSLANTNRPSHHLPTLTSPRTNPASVRIPSLATNNAYRSPPILTHPPHDTTMGQPIPVTAPASKAPSQGISNIPPARRGSATGPTPTVPISRAPNVRREAASKQPPLQQGAKVVFTESAPTIPIARAPNVRGQAVDGQSSRQDGRRAVLHPPTGKAADPEAMVKMVKAVPTELRSWGLKGPLLQ